MKRFLLLFLVVLLQFVSQAQELKGRVVDAKTQEPISGASVYIDGTSKGVITDLDGYFTFNYPKSVKADLIIRMMSYNTQRFSNPLEEDLSLVQLVQKASQLDAVFLNPDPWSRAKKVDYFKKYFLGTTFMADRCKILNLDEVRLRFNPATGLLTARCDEPIIIENRYLGYKITYDLIDFELQFENSILKAGPEIKLPNNVPYIQEFRLKEAYYSGSSFYQELSTNDRKIKRFIKRRHKLYENSELKFYRTLKSNLLQDEIYEFYYDRNRVGIDGHIRIRQFDNFSRVVFRNKKYALLDKDGNRSDLFLTGNPVIIDSFGNNLTGKDIKFSGYLAELRVSGMLPLDFNIEQ